MFGLFVHPFSHTCDISKPTIFADDTNIIFTHSNLTAFKEEINIVVQKISN